VQDIGVIIYQPCCDVRSKSSGKREPLRKKKMKRAPLISRRTFFPFFGPPVLPVRNKKYSSGIIASNKGPLFISRGIGWAILPVRFNCYPEIAILELT
jgi:hypothetical protein